MKSIADSSLLALGAAAIFAVLSGQAAPGPATQIAPASPGAKTTTATRPDVPQPHGGRDHAWQHQLGRPNSAASTLMTPEMIDVCMEVAHDIDEGLATKLEALRKRDVKQFAAKLRNSRRLIGLAQLKQKSPSSYGLKLAELRVDAEVNRLAAEVRRARKAGRLSDARTLEEDLKRQTILQIAFRHRTREDYLCRLQEMVERLEKELADERENFDDVLEDRMAELLRDPKARQGDTGLSAPIPELDQASRLIPDLPE